MDSVLDVFSLFAPELAARFPNREVRRMLTSVSPQEDDDRNWPLENYFRHVVAQAPQGPNSLLALHERISSPNVVVIVNIPPTLVSADQRLDPYIRVLQRVSSRVVVDAFNNARLILARPSRHPNPNRSGLQTGTHRSGLPSLLYDVEFSEEFQGMKMWQIADEVDRRDIMDVMTVSEVLMLGIQCSVLVAEKEIVALRSRHGGGDSRTCAIPNIVRGSFMSVYFGATEIGIRPIDVNEVHGSGRVYAATYRANLVPDYPDTIPKEFRAS